MRCAAGCLLLAILIPGAAAPDDARLRQLLAAVARYVESYEPQLSSMIAEEDYRQSIRRPRSRRQERRTTSDFLFLKLPGAVNWVGFRDVYVADGEPVRSERDRFSRIVRSGEDVSRQAAELAAESARFNLGPDVRVINVPTLVLGWLASEPQRRFAFELRGRKTVSGVRCHVVAFEERQLPTLIRGRGDTNLASSGTFCASEDGRVWRTELVPDGPARIAVTYAFDPRVAMPVPAEMRETYRRGAIECVARYSNYRRFSVSTRIR